MAVLRELARSYVAMISYWVTDLRALNPHFGNEADLKALSKAVHDRGM